MARKSAPVSLVSPAPSVNGNGAHAAPVVPEAKGYVIKMPNYQITTIKVIGTSPLISNAVPAKLLQQWEEERCQDQPASKGKVKKARPARNYDQEFQDACYPIDGEPGHFGFPAMGFKHAIVGAVRQVEGLAMTDAKRLCFVLSDGMSRGYNVVRIIGTPEMRRDMVRLKDMNRTPDIRFRGGFFPWAAILKIEHNLDILPVESLLSLVAIAGRSEGIGEWRPSSGTTGDNGRFRLADKGE